MFVMQNFEIQRRRRRKKKKEEEEERRRRRRRRKKKKRKKERRRKLSEKPAMADKCHLLLLLFALTQTPFRVPEPAPRSRLRRRALQNPFSPETPRSKYSSYGEARFS
jgi:hypothetical protein